MAGKGYISHGKNIFDDMQAAIDGVHKRLDMFIGASKQPTMPTYPFATANPGDLPDDPVQGQVAISGDDDTLWFYSNGDWHKTGGAANLAHIEGIIYGTTTTWPDSGATFPQGGLLGNEGASVLLTPEFPGPNDRLIANGGIFLTGGTWLIFAGLRLLITTTPPALTSIVGFHPEFRQSDGINPALENIAAIPLAKAENAGVTVGSDRVWDSHLIYLAHVKAFAENDEPFYFVNDSDSVFDTATIPLATPASLYWTAIRITDGQVF